MSQLISPTAFGVPFKLNLQETKLTEDQFVRLCQENPDLRIELTTQGELVIMPPTGLEPGRRNIRLARRLDTWTEAEGSGIAFDSSTLFTLPNGAQRSPDASWVRRERWEALSPEQRRGFGLLCPDFVVELRSPSDRLVDLQEKMQEYIANGASLITGWGEGLQSLPSDAYAAAAGRRILPLPTPQCDDDRLRRATRECLLAITAVDQALRHSPLSAHDLAGQRTALVYASASSYVARQLGLLTCGYQQCHVFPLYRSKRRPGRSQHVFQHYRPVPFFLERRQRGA